MTAGCQYAHIRSGDGEYTYVWKTDKLWPATSCRQLALLLTDGGAHVANFQFK